MFLEKLIEQHIFVQYLLIKTSDFSRFNTE